MVKRRNMKNHPIFRKSTKGLRLLPISLCAILLFSCTQVDCPLNNMVYANYRFYDHYGDSIQIDDSLTVITHCNEMQDSILINRKTKTTSFMLPVSYGQREDEFYMKLKNTERTICDTIWVTKESLPHFESVDCNPVFFHTVTDVRCTHNIIDSVVINNKKIDYDSSKEHFKIYLYTGY